MEPCIQDPSHVQFRIDTLVVNNGKPFKSMKPDEDGYFVGLPLAGLGFPTRNKTFYDVDAFVHCMTNPNSGFYKRLSSGQLFGEKGHPDIEAIPPQLRMKRMLQIDEKNHAVHYRNVYSDSNTLPNGGKLVLGDLKPFGAGKQEVLDTLESPWMNTAFSLRSISDNRLINGISHRRMKNLVTFDWVGTGGFAEASKQYSPTSAMEDFEAYSLDIDENTLTMNGFSMESFCDTDLNDVLGTNQVVHISKTRDVIIMDPYHKDRLFMKGLTTGRVRDFLNSL